jgi:cytochrome c oxidase subunit 4
MASSQSDTHGHGSSTGEPHKDVASPKVYVLVFFALIALTVLTAICSRLPLGRWEAVVALSIASVKAGLVTLFFMHLIHMARLNWVIVSAGAFWLSIAFVLTLADYTTRSWYSIVATPETAVQNLTEVEQQFQEHRPPEVDVLPGAKIP